ncbi:MAG: hypothetical protein HKM89_11990 [Gemmatimonadales bacterium]|nr:hypothetical protein [Gemmatimonadales bacterium]
MTDQTYLTCEEMFRHLEDYLDHELRAEEVERVEAHLAICEICAKEYAFEGNLLDGIRKKLTRAKMPPDLARRIAATLDATPASDDD